MSEACRVAARATLDDLDRVAAILAAAFADDPAFLWLIPAGARDRDRRLLTLLRATAASYLRSSQDCYIDASGRSVALWTPPGRWRVPPGSILGDLRAFRSALGMRAGHALASLWTVERAHPRPAHWYLAFLATAPEEQGRGRGARLVGEVLEAADREGVAAYLESSNPRNLPFYQRLGFEVVNEVRLPFSGPPVYLLWRGAGQPAPGGRSGSGRLRR